MEIQEFHYFPASGVGGPRLPELAWDKRLFSCCYWATWMVSKDSMETDETPHWWQGMYMFRSCSWSLIATLPAWIPRCRSSYALRQKVRLYLHIASCTKSFHCKKINMNKARYTIYNMPKEVYVLPEWKTSRRSDNSTLKIMSLFLRLRTWNTPICGDKRRNLFWWDQWG
jgi:hypothetical protein